MFRSESAHPSAGLRGGWETKTPTSLLGWPLLTIALAAFLVQIPFFFLGTPSGHDVEFHTYSWLEVLSQWKQGVLYPRWAAMAHFAYGEPRFVFYPPASWTLGAALTAVLPWIVVPSVYTWIALVAAGASMFVLARQWLDRRDAIFAATFYAVNPYHLVIVYWRSALAELLASCLLPLLLLLILRAAEGRRVILPLGLLLAAAWLTNAPAAVMIHYSLALLVIVIAWQRRSPRLLLTAVTAVALGAALAAFYLLPAIYEQRWVNIGEAVSAGSRPQDNFLFIHTTDADHDHFNRIISLLAVAEIIVTLGAGWAVKKLRENTRQTWLALVGWAIACSALMFPITGLLWNFLPKLRFMQFPWRWMLCLSMILSLFLALGVKRWWTRFAVCMAMLLVVAFAWQRVQAPWWDQAADLREMQDNVATGVGYEGTDEYSPVGADPAAIDKDARRVTVNGPARAAIHVLNWDAESKLFTAEMSTADDLALRLFSYPAWRVEVNGKVVQAKEREPSGQMLIPVVAGSNHVQISFVRTWDRTCGGWISMLACISILVVGMLRRFSAGGEARSEAVI
jgi:6-pyruvoyl-tetrahydropterin synthase related domain